MSICHTMEDCERYSLAVMYLVTKPAALGYGSCLGSF
jgi:hypothetical protein